MKAWGSERGKNDDSRVVGQEVMVTSVKHWTERVRGCVY